MYECKICLKQFSSRGLLHAHLQVHVKRTLFYCKFCEQSFKSTALRKNHVKNYHNDEDEADSYSLFEESFEENEEQFKCEACEAMFSELKQVFVHLQAHTNEEEIKEIKKLEEMLKESQQKLSKKENCINGHKSGNENVNLNREDVRKDDFLKCENDCEVHIVEKTSQNVHENNKIMTASVINTYDKESLYSGMNSKVNFDENIVKKESDGGGHMESDSDMSNQDDDLGFSDDILNDLEMSRDRPLKAKSTFCEDKQVECQKSQSPSFENLSCLDNSQKTLPSDVDLQNKSKLSQSNSQNSENEEENGEAMDEIMPFDMLIDGDDSSKSETEALIEDEMSQNGLLTNQNDSVINILPKIEISTKRQRIPSKDQNVGENDKNESNSKPRKSSKKEGNSIRKKSNNVDLNKGETLKAHEKQFRCIRCSKVFAKRRYFVKHWRAMHERNKGVPCTLCSRSFEKPSQLEDHMATHTVVRIYFCEYCGKSFKKNAHLNEHKRMHTGEKPFKCKKCPMAFSYGKQLKEHDMEHTGIRPFCCDVCGKTFTRSTMLKDHLIIHSDARDFECDICGKNYKLRRPLQKHLKDKHKYKLEKLHECGFCSKKFPTDLGLKRHIKIHDTEKPFKCLVCSEKFKCEADVKVHMESQHVERETPKKIKAVRLSSDEQPDESPCQKQDNTTVNEIVNESVSEKQTNLIENIPDEKTESTNDESTHQTDVSVDGATDVSVDGATDVSVDRATDVSVDGATDVSVDRATDVSVEGATQDCQPNVPIKIIPKEGMDFESNDTTTETGNVESNEMSDNRDIQAEGEYLKLEPATDENMINNEKSTCDICGEVIGTAAEMKSHMLIHKPYVCSYCGKGCKQKHHLEEHLRIHTGEKPFKCNKCPLAFASPKSLKYHDMSHTGIRPHRCEICGKGFKGGAMLKDHMACHSDERNFSCDICGSKFKLRTSLVGHKRMVHVKKKVLDLECGICFKKFKMQKLFDNHKKAHERDGCFQCQQCEKIFFEENALKEHQLSHSKDDKGIESEKIHGKKTLELKKDQQPQHKQSESEAWVGVDDEQELSYPCYRCRERFATVAELRDHMSTHPADRPYICSHCKKCFKKKDHLDEHLRMHTGERPFKCTKCPKAFSYKKSLKSHDIMEHAGIGFDCEICGKIFTRQTSLKVHMISHSDKRDYPCDICGNCFKTEKTLKLHSKIHGDQRQKSHDCSKCGKKFLSIKFLTNHKARCKPYVPKREKDEEMEEILKLCEEKVMKWESENEDM